MYFNEFNKALEENRIENVPNQKGLSYVLLNLISFSNLEDIDFSAFTESDIELAKEELSIAIYRDYDEMDDSYYFKPNTPLTQIHALSHKIYQLETTPKKWMPSSYQFL